MRDHSYTGTSASIWGKPYCLALFFWGCTPKRFRSRFYWNPLKTACRDFLAKFAGRGDLYGAAYYAHVDEAASISAPTIVESVCSRFAPRRIIDVGCGTGALLAAFQAKGVAAMGLEYSPVALDICETRGLEVYSFNIEDGRQPGFGAFDVSICCEVAEHVSAACADSLVDMLARLAPHVVFTAATPGQGGVDHVNEQPHEYWVAKFEQRGYSLLDEITLQWREEWPQKDVVDCYSRNVMVFEKTE